MATTSSSSKWARSYANFMALMSRGSCRGAQSGSPAPLRRINSAEKSPIPPSSLSWSIASERGIARSASGSSLPSRAARAIPRNHSGLRPESPGKSFEIEQSLRGRKGEQRCSVEHHRVPEPLCHLRLDGGGLDHADPVPDDRPTSGLIRGPEADWAQAPVLRLKSRHNLVPLSDVGKLPCIHVERENTSDVGCHGFG